MNDITAAQAFVFPMLSLTPCLGMISLLGVLVETRVILENSSPAVMDSNVTFTARLIGNKFNKSSLYTYEWKDNAVIFHLPLDRVTTQGPANVTLSRQFPAYPFSISPGTFTMNLTVYAEDEINENERKVIGSASSYFVLTDHLNFKMELLQDLPVTPPPRVFATGKYIRLMAIMQDIFSDAKLKYEWYLNNGTETQITSSPNYMARFCCQGEQVIGLTVNASIKMLNFLGEYVTISKTGHINRNVILKDPIKALDFHGETSYEQGDVLQGNLSCQGSPPFDMCVNVTSPDGEHVQQCLPPNSSTSCLLTMIYKLPQVGNYTLNIVAWNDVSKVKGEVFVNVAEPAQTHVTPFLPVACIIIAIGFLASLGYAYYYDRRKIRESGYETADFHFHPAPVMRRWNNSAAMEKLRRAASVIAKSARNAYQRRVAPVDQYIVSNDLSVNSDFDYEVI